MQKNSDQFEQLGIDSPHRLDMQSRQRRMASINGYGIPKHKIMSKEHIYTLHLTKRQVELLSYACDRFSRLICGQDWTYQELFEQAWEKRCKEATGNMMDKEWQGGWLNMRDDAKVMSEEIKRRYWGLQPNTMYGIHYDDTADILFSLHQVLRHQLWLDRPDDKKSPITVDAEPAMRWGSEPLAIIKKEK